MGYGDTVRTLVPPRGMGPGAPSAGSKTTNLGKTREIGKSMEFLEFLENMENYGISGISGKYGIYHGIMGFITGLWDLSRELWNRDRDRDRDWYTNTNTDTDTDTDTATVMHRTVMHRTVMHRTVLTNSVKSPLKLGPVLTFCQKDTEVVHGGVTVVSQWCHSGVINGVIMTTLTSRFPRDSSTFPNSHAKSRKIP